jgi:hypothetical protein
MIGRVLNQGTGRGPAALTTRLGGKPLKGFSSGWLRGVVKGPGQCLWVTLLEAGCRRGSRSHFCHMGLLTVPSVKEQVLEGNQLLRPAYYFLMEPTGITIAEVDNLYATPTSDEVK